MGTITTTVYLRYRRLGMGFARGEAGPLVSAARSLGISGTPLCDDERSGRAMCRLIGKKPGGNHQNVSGAFR